MALLGQYFTTDIDLQNKVCEFIQNEPNESNEKILEPSVGRGDLVRCVLNKYPDAKFDMYEIDSTIKPLSDISEIIYEDFLKTSIDTQYKTIIGNPPYIRTKKGNLYIDFIEKCWELLTNDYGELIFIVPSDFFKLTSASSILMRMMDTGTFTHIYHPHDELRFEGATIDVVVFRYCKNIDLPKNVLYNDEIMNIVNTDGLITFEPYNEIKKNMCKFEDIFNIYVGIVSGKEDIYKNNLLGNINVLNGKNIIDRYIFIRSFPSEDDTINSYLLDHKEELMNRKIRKFDEHNWFEWGALRNINAVNNNIGKDCIYIYNLTRKKEVAFIGKVGYFGGNLLMLLPKIPCDLFKIISYLNNDSFKNNFIFSGRFKIGHRQLSKSLISITEF